MTMKFTISANRSQQHVKLKLGLVLSYVHFVKFKTETVVAGLWQQIIPLGHYL